mmetsp:Transcript_123903/g.361859  ORF Transcript_123903/g.361859 Transcript_123903/m.361859 type:complete len:523 (+) Transcript_123903:98-1666(+)
MAEVPRSQLVQLIAGMVERKGPAMEAELRRRIDVGEDLEIRGVKVDAAVLKEALEKHQQSSRPASAAPGKCAAAEPPVAPAKPAATQPSAAPAKPAAAQPSTQSTPPPSKQASGARWCPGAPSASLLAARALQECEQAEVFCRFVRVAGDATVPLHAKPDVLSDRTGEYLAAGSSCEVVARFVSQRDGRAYLRMKCQSGWASTRACDLFAKMVLEPMQGDPPLEPSRCGEPIESKALELLPLLDAAEAAESPVDPDASVGGEDGADVPVGDGEDDIPEDDGHAEAEDAIEEEDEEQQDATVDHEDPPTQEGEDEGEEGGASDKENRNDADPGLDASKGSPQRKERKFKVAVGRCPVIAVPDASHLMAHGARTLQHKEEFLANGAVFVPAEQRTYLRLTRGRGWVCERSHNDLRRLAVVPLTKRRKPLSKKMAKVVVFRGGDADGATKLRKEDLVKNAAGKVVSKKASEAAKKRYLDGIGKWTAAVKRARDELGVEGFVKVKKGTPVYEKAQEFYKQAASGKA